MKKFISQLFATLILVTAFNMSFAQMPMDNGPESEVEFAYSGATAQKENVVHNFKTPELTLDEADELTSFENFKGVIADPGFVSYHFSARNKTLKVVMTNESTFNAEALVAQLNDQFGEQFMAHK